MQSKTKWLWHRSGSQFRYFIISSMDTTKDKDASLTTSTELVVYTSPNVQPSTQSLLRVTLESEELLAWLDGVESTRSKCHLIS